jgi:hypothetical protein
MSTSKLIELGLRLCPFVKFIDLEEELAKGKTIVLDGCFHDALKMYFYNICVSPRFLGRTSVDVFQFSPRSLNETYRIGRDEAIGFERFTRTTAPHLRERDPEMRCSGDIVDDEYASRLASAMKEGSKLVVNLSPYPHLADPYYKNNPDLIRIVEEGYPTRSDVLHETFTAIRDGLYQIIDATDLPLIALDLHDRDETPQLLSLLEEIRSIGAPLLIFRIDDNGGTDSESLIKADNTIWSTTGRVSLHGRPIEAHLKGGKKIYLRNRWPSPLNKKA